MEEQSGLGLIAITEGLGRLLGLISAFKVVESRKSTFEKLDTKQL